MTDGLSGVGTRREAVAASPDVGRSRKFLERPAIHLLLVALVAVLGYANTFHVPFVFDDHGSIVDNPVIKDLSAFLTGAGYAYNPSRFAGYLSFALNYKLGGLNVIGYHLVNLAIHIVNAWLVYCLARLTLRTPFFATSGRALPVTDAESRNSKLETLNFFPVLAALLFVAHPVQTQAVTYIVQRLTSLATLFFLLSLVLYASARLEESRSKKSLVFLGLSLLSAIFAMRTKEITVTLPLAVVLYEFSFFAAGARKRLLFLVPLLLTALIIPIGMMHAGKPLGEILSDVSAMARETQTISRGDYLLTQFSVIVTYVRLLFLPVNQTLDYDYPLYHSLLAPRVFLSFAFLLALFSLAVWLYRRSSRTTEQRPFTVVERLIGFGIFWFFLTLSVESSVIPIRDVIYEHRLYLPSVGVFFALAAGTAFLSTVFSPRTLVITASAVVLVLSAATLKRNHVWGDNVEFCRDNVDKSPGKSRPHSGLGKALLETGKTAAAMEEFGAAVKIDPDDPIARFNLGTGYGVIGQFDEAIGQFKAAIRLDSEFAEAHANLGVAYIKMGLLDKAIEELRIAVRLRPANADAHYNLGVSYSAKGLLDEAVAEYQTAIRLNPGNAAVHSLLGDAYRRMGAGPSGN